MVLSRSAVVLALLLVCPEMLLAQQSGPAANDLAGTDSLADVAIHDWRPSGCLATLAPMSMHRKPVFLGATMPPRTDSLFTLQADLIAQDVAAEIRKELGARGVDAPIADGKISWYSVPTQIVVTAMRNGDMRLRSRGAAGDSSATTLLARAFDAARARGTLLLVWPDNNTADSVLIRLTLVAQSVNESDALYPYALARVKFAAFFLSVPDETPARFVDGQPPPRYPEYNERNRVSGELLMRIVVDSTGKVIPSSIHDVWPENKPRLNGEMGRYYDAFVTSVTAWEQRVRYEPARVGVCPVTAVLLHPLGFMAR